MENFTEELIRFIPPELIIVVVATYCVGLLLKKMPKIKDEIIPVILPVFSIAFSLIIGGIKPCNFLFGIIGATIAVYSNNVFKQINKLKEDQ